MQSVGGSVTGVARVRSQREGYVPKKLYECLSYRKYGKARCVCHNVREDVLLASLKNFLIALKDNYKQEIANLRLEEYKSNKQNDLNKLKDSLRILETEYKVILSEKIKELSSCNPDKKSFIESTYKSMEDEKYKEIENTKKQIENLGQEDLKVKEEKLKKSIDYFNQVIDSRVPDKAILNMLIDKIYIYHDKSVKFVLKIDIEKML